jgi:transposase-like protein
LKHYPGKVKLVLIQKILAQPHRSMRSIAKEAGVCKSTLHEWITFYRNGHNMSPGVSSQDRPLLHRLKAISDCSQLDEFSIGKYCRRHGIYREHLDQWKEVMMNDNQSVKSSKAQAENKALRKRNAQLEKALKKTEGRLTEANALLDLKKKLHLLLKESGVD